MEIKRKVLKSKLRSAEIDNIFADGYAECLKDTVKHMHTILYHVNENGEDPVEQLEKFIESINDILENDGSDIQ